MKTQELSLAALAASGAGEVFDHELAKALADIQDPNRDAKSVRAVTLTLMLRPIGDEREEVAVQHRVAVKLGSFAPMKAEKAYLGMRDGKLVAVTVDPRQESLFDEQPAADKVTPISMRRAE